MTKVLYVCPLAHLAGHPPWASMNEPKALADIGLDVTLLTFCGIRKGCEALVPETHVIKKDYLDTLRKYLLLQWVVRIFECGFTLLKAAWLSRHYDIIHLRDGEPFPFIPHLLSVFFRRKWLVSLTGGIFTVTDSTKTTGRKGLLPLYRLLFNTVINGPQWRLIYVLGHKYSKFRYITQDSQTASHYNHMFKDKIHVVPMGSELKQLMSRVEARKRLGLPLDKTVLLLFGVPHSGKDNEVVFRALKDLPNTTLICAGASYLSVGQSSAYLAKKYDLGSKAKIYDFFIPESEKSMFFGASDWAILSYTKAFSSTSSMLWESCAYQLPVISSDANILSELVRKYDVGLLFEAEDSESLKEIIIQAARVDRTELKANCKKFVQEHSLEKWANRCKEIYGSY